MGSEACCPPGDRGGAGIAAVCCGMDGSRSFCKRAGTHRKHGTLCCSINRTDRNGRSACGRMPMRSLSISTTSRVQVKASWGSHRNIRRLSCVMPMCYAVVHGTRHNSANAGGGRCISGVRTCLVAGEDGACDASPLHALRPTAGAAWLGPGDAGGLAAKNDVMACWLRSGALLARSPPPFFAGGIFVLALPVAEGSFLLLLAAAGAVSTALFALRLCPADQKGQHV